MSNKHHDWERQWHDAFDGAEVPPASHVWKNIERDLAFQESGKYRRGFFFYRAIAAALLLLITGLSWYIVTNRQEGDSATLSEEAGQTGPNISTTPPADTGQSIALSDEPVSPDDVTHRGNEAPSSNKSKSARLSEATNTPLTEATGTTKDQPSSVYQDARSEETDTGARPSGTPTTPLTHRDALSNVGISDEVETHRSVPGNDPFTLQTPLQSTVAGRELATKSEVSQMARVAGQGAATPSMSLPSSLAGTEKLYLVPQPVVPFRQQGKRTRPSFFAGLALAPSYFDPQFQAAGGSNFNVANADVPSGAPALLNYQADADRAVAPSTSVGTDDTPELSFSYGLDVGMRLSDHWVLESGIDYNRYSTTAETRWVAADVASGNRYAFVAANSAALLENSSPSINTTTSINNAYEFIAVPMKVGYSITMSKLQFTLSSGVAANFFLSNVISDAARQLADYELLPSSSNTPFNPWYLSGILSGGVNYNILGNYFLSLSPSYAFALTELTKAASEIESQPRSLGINLGFQYQF